MDFEGWAIVELMGHRRLGAWVSEVELAGAPMLRLDIPAYPWQNGCTCGSDEPDNPDHTAHQSFCRMFGVEGDEAPGDVYATQVYSAAALYCLTPSTEEMARSLRSRPEPVARWEIERREIGASVSASVPLDESVLDLDDEDNPF